MFLTAQLTESYQRRNQDRLDLIPHAHGLVAVLADGAGGTSGGAEAADTVLLYVRSSVTIAADLRPPQQWADLLVKIDRQLSYANGQSTAVIVALFDAGLSGASVGDSAAWLIHNEDHDDLTREQVRKPLLGTGSATPVAFSRPAFAGPSDTLLLASDGLTKYAPTQKLCAAARLPDLSQAARALLDSVRLKSGALQDDTSVILCRARAGSSGSSPQVLPGRKRYTLTADGQMLEER